MAVGLGPGGDFGEGIAVAAHKGETNLSCTSFVKMCGVWV